jgi:hypothetical protein
VLVEGLPGEKLAGHLAETGLARTQSGGRMATGR